MDKRNDFLFSKDQKIIALHVKQIATYSKATTTQIAAETFQRFINIYITVF